ncbi:hypothetical protein SBOR_0985 [Sclerotinia borealis F-4128]|uniref:Mid2 domain-containing protein n=1 Tax=Sclerotinia borealis (strain F-4128) TaxID=1432307 RepID=W9CVP4_SCLBF|nr:hypothetical protein SBOR_0985 [Sclerotinia borealis F-4128]
MSSTLMGSCILGGKWYTCEDQSPTFLGCCLSDPCNGIGCPAENLRPAAMGTASGPDAPSADGSYWPNVSCPNGGVWFTCSEQTNSFQGCCDNSTGFNPCHGTGCPTESLYAAAFSTVPAKIFSATSSTAFAASSTISISSTISVTSSVPSSSSISNSPNGTSSTSQTASSQTSATANDTSDSIGFNSYQKLPIAAIVGSALGGVVVVLLVLLASFCIRRRRKRAMLEGSNVPGYQLQQDMSMVKATPPSFVYETSPSDAKMSSKGNQNTPESSEYLIHTNDSVNYRPISQIPLSPPFSPAPPYRSQPQSPGVSDQHEIDSSTVHEVESPPLRNWSLIPRPGAAEMPDTSEDTWRSSIPHALKPGPSGN